MAEKIIVVAGPTASGKTRLGIALAQELGGEIVSADSMQIYRRMDIGTAKATAAEQAAVPHHMIDVAEPWENYSVARYVKEASRCCEDIISRGKLPAGDKRRIVRAIEIYKLTGMTITKHDARTRAMPPRYDAAQIILGYADRAALYARIDRRVDEMVAEGRFEEVQGLLDSGLSEQCTAMQAIGYKEPAMALRGEISRGEAVELIKLGSRRYAKRQMTWFRRTKNALRIDWDENPDFEAARRLSTAFLHDSGIL